MKKQIISAALAAVISAGLFVSPVQQYVGTSTVAFAAETVSVPKASRKSGTYSSSGTLTVRLTADSGSQIYYSTGGSYKLYTKTLKITKNTTLKFYAQKNGAKSKTVTVKYKLTPKVKVTNAGGNYDSAVTVKLSSTASGVKFYYTLDGSKPTKSSALYTTKGITVSKSAKLRVLAAKTGWSGKYLAEEYTISGSEETSTLSGESILEDYKSKYAYNTLTAKQKKLYEVIYNGAAAHKIVLADFGVFAVEKFIAEKNFRPYKRLIAVRQNFSAVHNKHLSAVQGVGLIHLRQRAFGDIHNKLAGGVICVVVAHFHRDRKIVVSAVFKAFDFATVETDFAGVHNIFDETAFQRSAAGDQQPGQNDDDFFHGLFHKQKITKLSVYIIAVRKK